MSNRRRRSQPTAAATVSAQHADWLTLVEPSGQFLTLPVLKEAFPTGLEPLPTQQRREVREWAAELDRDNVGEATEWIEYLLSDVLGWGPRLLSGLEIPEHLSHTVAEHRTTLRPEYVLKDKDGSPRALVERYMHGTQLDSRLPGDNWAASPIDRTAALCRALGVPIGIVTDSRYVVLVYAPQGAVGGHATWDTTLFSEGAEAHLLDALVNTIGARAFFARKPGDRIEDLLAKSADAQTELTNTLGLQVRRAVELLVSSIGRADLAREGKLLRGVSAHQVYEAAATTIMRLVFLLYAEERNLLPLGEPIYDENYAASTLYDQLREQSDRDGDEPLELRSTAWQRLLATFRAVYGGIEHDRLRMPPYGGSLFDPDRFPFLEGRAADDPWRATAARPIKVDDLTVREIMRALQFITTTEAGARESRRLSFRTLDVEQIGHIYEGTLDHSAVYSERTVVGLVGKSAGNEPEVALHELEAAAADGREALVTKLKDETQKTQRQVVKLLDEPLDDDAERKLREATDNDSELTERLRPFAGLLRDDLRGLPIVFVAGTIYVTETSQRRDTGTEYTPRELAEEIVLHALEPLVYEPGPAQGAERANWQLKSSEEILSLSVCDPAVGSGAILVAACRYLGDRVLEAWTEEQYETIPAGYQPSEATDREEDEFVVLARRAVVDRCLYGVDRDPMAVEMTKLSLWLTTMSRERPFTFIDHAIRSGDSLLGVTSLDQITSFHMDPTRGRQMHQADLYTELGAKIQPLVDKAMNLRRKIASEPVVTVRDVERKAAWHEQARGLLREAGVLADLVVGAALISMGKDTEMENKLITVQDRVMDAFTLSGAKRDEAFQSLRLTANEWLDAGRPDSAPARRPLHWPLAFPDVVDTGGFDAMVGNPPFQGGKKISSAAGSDFREFLVQWIALGRKGNADLVTYFFLRSANVAEGFGFIATNTIAQGDTREVGLDWLLDNGWTLPWANKSRPWPGSASLEIAEVWAVSREWVGAHVLDGSTVSGISATLDPASRVPGKPKRLAASTGVAFQGSNLNGIGFVVSEEKAHAWIVADPRNAVVLFPYLNGKDLNQSPTQSASRWVINYFDWTEDQASTYSLPFLHVVDFVKPRRDQLPDYKRRVRERFWRYEASGVALYTAIKDLDYVIAITLVSSVVQPVRVPNPQVFAHKLAIFADDSLALLGLISSNVHGEWARKYSSSLETRINYSPSDVFETFPFPENWESLLSEGRAMENARATVMRGRDIGLTDAYNLVNDPEIEDPDVLVLRNAHLDLDHAVMRSYGWNDMDLDHDFYKTAQGIRYTIDPVVRVELLDRLLELNHERHAAEVELGLHNKKLVKRPAKKRIKKQTQTDPSEEQLGLDLPKVDR